jgi:DMSO/TMAO reductase YedYZ heme-binding membrane subunit
MWLYIDIITAKQLLGSFYRKIFNYINIFFGMVGFLILFMLPVAIISSRIMRKKNIIKVVDKEENE